MAKNSTKGFKSSIGLGGSKPISNTSVQFGNAKGPCADDRGSRAVNGKPNTKGADTAAKKVGPMAKTPELSVGLKSGDGQKRK